MEPFRFACPGSGQLPLHKVVSDCKLDRDHLFIAWTASVVVWQLAASLTQGQLSLGFSTTEHLSSILADLCGAVFNISAECLRDVYSSQLGLF